MSSKREHVSDSKHSISSVRPLQVAASAPVGRKLSVSIVVFICFEKKINKWKNVFNLHLTSTFVLSVLSLYLALLLVGDCDHFTVHSCWMVVSSSSLSVKWMTTVFELRWLIFIFYSHNCTFGLRQLKSCSVNPSLRGRCFRCVPSEWGLKVRPITHLTDLI